MTRPVTANPGHCLMRAVITKRARGLLEDVIKHLPATSAERAALDAAVRAIVQADELRIQERDAAARAEAAVAALSIGYAGPVIPPPPPRTAREARIEADLPYLLREQAC